MAQSTDHKEARASVRYVYRHYDVQKDGTCPFFICITKQRKRKYVATGLTLHPKYWDESKQAIRRSYPDHLKRELQSQLRKLVERYENAANALADADEQHDADTVASKAVEGRKQTRRTTLLAYIDSLVASMTKAGRTGNSLIYKDLRNQLAKFVKDEYGADDLPFDKVTVAFCNEWETTLRATGASDNTLSNRFRTPNPNPTRLPGALPISISSALPNSTPRPKSGPSAGTTCVRLRTTCLSLSIRRMTLKANGTPKPLPT